MILHQANPPRTLDALVARFSDAPAGTRVEAWTFDDRAARRRTEGALATRGITARIRSAYKPVVSFFLEEARPGFTAARIAYPVHPAAIPNRFLLESYPLAALLAPAAVSFTAGTCTDLYDITLTYPEGTETHRVFAPNREHPDLEGAPMLSPCGWLIAGDQSAPMPTDYEALFHGAMEAVAAHDWGQEPYFEELNLAVTIPADDEALNHDDEALSLREALHEDLYFSLLEYFGQLSGRPVGDRHLQPGQIVPEITQGPPGLTVSLRPLATGDRMGAHQVLDNTTAPPAAAQIRDELAALGGTRFTAPTRAGREVEARHISGDGAPVMISAGQHPNETSAIVGALRAGRVLKERGASFTLSPLENPDGYALHGRLVADNPRHMHHAARYTAFGDDLEYRQAPSALYENAIRQQAETLSRAQLHINLHGYPAHEWTRPLSGYVPRGFAMWTLPKGFFLVMRHHEGWADIARALTEAVTADLARNTELMEMNARQIALYATHAGETGFEMVNGFPCYIGPDPRHRVPLTLITEYPDETIYGPAFIRAHEAQMQTVLAAQAAWQGLAASAPSALLV
ncbi:M14 family metallopeptidase [Paracoccus xiamenensis]|uniref:peptidase M14 n=1 Tax=Paracoccus xiamenensis TaxID=2714901 RepID=UPI00140A79A4|nr:peptidase M14 [Paracoccus xiamenensis]NHF73440.1 peptidase M14 [Paracoccus xiamenensis]